MVKVSVIVPVFNVDKYLSQCLDSIVNQTLTDIEIICINDGSTDNCSRILKEYENKDSRITVITQENKGLSNARNRGLEIACGEYVYFIDSDDYLDLNALDELYDLSKEKNLDLLIFKLVNFDDKGNQDFHYSDMPFLADISKETFTYHDFKQNLLDVDETVYTKFFKKDLISKIRFPDGLIFEDTTAYLDYILNAERISFYDKCFYHRRLREDSIISKASKNYADVMEVYEIVGEKLKEHGLYEEYKEEFFARKIDVMYYRFNLIQPKYKQYFYEKMKMHFLNQKEEYEREMDLANISEYIKNIYEAVMESKYFNEIESYIELYHLKRDFEDVKNENKKLKMEYEKLNKLNQNLLSSKSWKLTEPLRKSKGMYLWLKSLL